MGCKEQMGRVNNRFYKHIRAKISIILWLVESDVEDGQR